MTYLYIYLYSLKSYNRPFEYNHVARDEIEFDTPALKHNKAPLKCGCIILANRQKGEVQVYIDLLIVRD